MAALATMAVAGVVALVPHGVPGASAAEPVRDMAGAVLQSPPEPRAAIPHRSSSPDSDPLGYWTADRMRSAVRAGSPAGARAEATAGNSASGHPMQTVGKLFYVDANGQDSWCTAAVINGSSHNLVETAGHCVYTYGRGWNTKFAFAPGYDNGRAPYLVWDYSRAFTLSAWALHQDDEHDQGFVAFQRRLVYTHRPYWAYLTDWVGGNTLRTGLGNDVKKVTVVGYPTYWPLTGESQGTCTGDAEPFPGFTEHATVLHGCRMTPGSSGGPWFSTMTSADSGEVFAVTTLGRFLLPDPYALAVPNDWEVWCMYLIASARS
ncbi:trypsin-like serine peptidase [Leifsonia xyli]|uniref:trypsin-like serine peptidase n=1 Tax=Leifsonia xyli TaxID=1575 RepID=UPI000406C5FC|nr:hypothetical protein [Leifsonia xyli]